MTYFAMHTPSSFPVDEETYHFAGARFKLCSQGAVL